MEQTVLSRNEIYLILVIGKALVWVILYFIRSYHQEGVKKLESIVGGIKDMRDDIHELRRQTSISDYKLKEGTKQFDKIQDHQRDQDLKIDRNNELLNNLGERVTRLETLKEKE